MNRNTFRTLEFERIRELLSLEAGSNSGRERARSLSPSTTPAEVKGALQLTKEGVKLLAALGLQPYRDLPDLGPLLPLLGIEGSHVEPRSLFEVASFIDGSGEIARSTMSEEALAPALARLCRAVKDLGTISASIKRCILPSGEVADEASPRLRELRRELARLRSSLDALMESFLKARDAGRVLQERLVTARNDRLVLLVKAEQRGMVPGIIHGSSSSGASLFVEPLPAVEVNNDIVSVTEQERAEVLRILKALTAEVGEELPALASAVDVMGELDFIQAKALLSRAMRAVEPELGDRLELRGARHPLLIPALTERLGLPKRISGEPVPVDLSIGGEQNVLVISGPNTGGKTVALKTVGLLALMAQSGLHVPALPGSVLPVFVRIFADIGDDQSIAESLSTFSAHLKSIVEMARDLEEPALVLLDEVGGGTDPTEGGPLGVSIVDHFRGRGALVVATTHHGLLKAYAQSEPGVVCASFGYDPESYLPNYRLTVGAPGRSLAFEMAEKLGLPAAIVAQARSRVDSKELQAEALLKTLEQERARLEQEREGLERDQRTFEGEKAKEAEGERLLEERLAREVEAFRKELAKAGEEARRRMAEAVSAAVQKIEASRRPVVSSRARAASLKGIREAEEEALPTRSAAGDLKVGQRVRVVGLGFVGEVLAVREDGLVEIASSGKRLQVGKKDVAPIDTRVVSAPTPRIQKTVPSEINLVGLTVEEALPQVDKLLDDAALSEQRSIRVIHGFGSGRLRQAVASFLNGHPHVAAIRTGGSGEGGGGVTVVELKD